MYSSFFQDAPIPILCTDREGTIIYANARMESILQKSKTLLQQTAIQEHIVPVQHTVIDSMLSDPALHPQAKVQFFRGKQDIAVLDVSISQNENSIMWFCEDNRKIEQLEKEKKQLQTLPKEYGHSINNLLTVILSATQLIEMDLEEESEIYQDIQDISEAALRAAAQTRLFMQLGRQDRLHHARVSLDDFHTKHLGFLKTLWGEAALHWQHGLHYVGNEHALLIAISMTWIHLQQRSPHTKWAFSLQEVELSHQVAVNCCGLNGGNYVCICFFDEGFENFLSLHTQDMYITQEESPLLAPVWDAIIRLSGSIIHSKNQRGQRGISLFIPLISKEETS